MKSKKRPLSAFSSIPTKALTEMDFVPEEDKLALPEVCHNVSSHMLVRRNFQYKYC